MTSLALSLSPYMSEIKIRKFEQIISKAPSSKCYDFVYIMNFSITKNICELPPKVKVLKKYLMPTFEIFHNFLR